MMKYIQLLILLICIKYSWAQDDGLIHIGNINGRNFYYKMQWMNNGNSREFCENLGLKLAYFEDKSETDILHQMLQPFEISLWTDAIIKENSYGFQYDSNSKWIPKDFDIIYNSSGIRIGLVLSTLPENKGRLVIDMLSESNYPLCVSQ